MFYNVDKVALGGESTSENFIQQKKSGGEKWYWLGGRSFMETQVPKVHRKNLGIIIPPHHPKQAHLGPLLILPVHPIHLNLGSV